jgi:hypothetical protein
MQYRFLSDDFSVRLPWFYFDKDFSRAKPNRVWSFEVNGLTGLAPGKYDLRFVLPDGMESVETSWDGEVFENLPAVTGIIDIHSRQIEHFMFSLYWRDSGEAAAPPVREIWLTPAGKSFPDDFANTRPYDTYRRETKLEERPVSRDWNWFYPALTKPGADLDELKAMVREIAEWAARRQVVDPEAIHYGAVYSEEDKYDFQDAAAAAVLFMRMFRWTGEPAWRLRAESARDYVYKGQHRDEANPVRFGGFPSMRGFESRDFCRLAYPLPAVNGVTTCIIGNLLIKLFEEGMKPRQRDCEALLHIAVWIANNESHPGVFRHHEGDERGGGGYGDCQNSNGLGTGAMARIITFLDKREFPPNSGHGDCQPSNAMGAGALQRIITFLEGRAACKNPAWRAAVRRGIDRMLAGQEAIGEWPYCFAAVGQRGQNYGDEGLPPHGMGLYHLLLAVEAEPYRGDKRICRMLRRAALWYLCLVEIEPETGSVNLAYTRDSNGLAFSSFSWCRFMCAASLFRIGEIIGEPEPFRAMALNLIKTIHTHYWNHDNPERAPVQASMHKELKPVTWIQAAEWDGVLLLEMIDRLEGDETNES